MSVVVTYPAVHQPQRDQECGTAIPHDRRPSSTRRLKKQVRWMYDAQGKPNNVENLVEAYAPLVKRIAFQLMARLPANVEVDDLIQSGMIGLLDAISRYETGHGAQFETYAVLRVRGAMLDGLRENDWLPRSLRRDMRRTETVIHELEQELGRAPSESEIAAALDMSLEDYQQLLFEARGHQLLYFEDFTAERDEDYLERHLAADEGDPLDLLLDADVRRRLVAAIDVLPEREQLVMALYYDKELNLREIGAVLGVSESRVCQLHSQAVARLRATVLGKAMPTPARRGRRPKQARTPA